MVRQLPDTDFCHGCRLEPAVATSVVRIVPRPVKVSHVTSLTLPVGFCLLACHAGSALAQDVPASAPSDVSTSATRVGPADAATIDSVDTLPPLSAVSTDDGAFSALNPDAPLDPLPDIGVDWPDLDTPLAPLPDLPPLAPVDSGDAIAAGVDSPDGAALPADEFAGVSDGGLTDLPDDPATGLPAALPGVSDGGETIVATGTADDPVTVASAESLRYSVQLEGLDGIRSRRFGARFDGLSVLRQGQDDPANGAQLNRRIVEDGALLDQMLRNEGYYDATLVSDLRRNGERLVITFAIQSGPRYTYSAVNLIGIEAVGPAEMARLVPTYGIDPGEPITADGIVKAQASMTAEMEENGYPFAQVGEELVTIDHDVRTGVLDQPVTPGPRLRFGQVIAEDGGLLGAAHIQQIARFEPGEWYRASSLEDLRRAIIATGLVSSVTITPVDSGDGSTVDTRVALTPGPLRTLSGGLGYSTGEGLRAEASWEHRNFWPPEGALILRGVVGTQEQLAGVTFRRNNYRGRDRVLTVQALASHLNRDAFDARTALLSARLERTTTLIYQKRWSWSAGAELIATSERSFDPLRNADVRLEYFIAGVNGLATYDRSNDLLDPTRGFRLTARLAPEFSFQGAPFGYVRAQLDGSLYHPFSQRVVLAGRVRVGTIWGAPASAIAPSRRYYAGGGSSVRGYGYQQVGPQDINGDPIGGKSLLEVAVEARVRLGTFSIVPFLDAGNISDNSLPGIGNLRVGAGIGVRYHSNFGPIRVDVGTPLNPRPGDSRIGVYVSLGQAF